VIKDPFKLQQKLRVLSYFDRFGLSRIKEFLFNHIFMRGYDNIVLPVDLDDFLSSDKKGNVLIIGNASNKVDYGKAIDSFNGDVIRFNRFRIKKEYGLGGKVTRWAVSGNLATDRDIYKDYFPKRCFELMKNNVDIFVASYPVIDSAINNVDIIDTEKCFEIYKKMCDLFMSSDGTIFPHDYSYYNKYQAFKPSTGLLTILHSILIYENVKIFNFDGFTSSHYWKEDNNDDYKRYYNANHVVGHHQPILESSIINTLLENGCISILEK